MKKILLGALAAVSGLMLVQCVNSEKRELKPERVVITGEVINYDKDVPTIAGVLFNDILDEMTDRQIMDLPRDGKFRLERDLLFGHDLTFQLDNRMLNFFASPGDSIHLVVDGQAFYEGRDGAVVFSGTNEALQQEYQKIMGYSENMYMQNIDAIMPLPPKEFMKGFKEMYKTFADSIDTYAKENGISDRVRDMAKRNMLFTNANILWDYQPEDPKARLEVLTDKLFDVNNEENFTTYMFPYHLSNISNAMIFPDEQFQEFSKAGNMKAAMKRAADILMERPANMSRDVMMYDVLYNFILQDKEYYNLIDNPVSLFSDPYFAEKLKEIAERPEQIPSMTLSGVYRLNDNKEAVLMEPVDFISFIKDQYKGKVVYMDIYATWCGPCRMEMTNAGKLHAKYADKNVAFVYACLSSPMDKWIPMIEEFKLEGDNYYFNDQSSREFMGKASLRGFPTYLLFDKEGNLVTRSAARPSQILEGNDMIDKQL